MGLKFKQGMPGKDYQTEKGDMDLGLDKLREETSEMLWRVMDENSQLKQENMMLKSKLEQIKRLF